MKNRKLWVTLKTPFDPYYMTYFPWSRLSGNHHTTIFPFTRDLDSNPESDTGTRHFEVFHEDSKRGGIHPVLPISPGLNPQGTESSVTQSETIMRLSDTRPFYQRKLPSWIILLVFQDLINLCVCRREKDGLCPPLKRG